MVYNHYHPQVPISIQGHSFTIDLYALPISGADIVLGVHWLRQLGPITTDYTTLSMPCIYLGQPVQLVADIPVRLVSASAHQLKHMFQTQSFLDLFILTPIPDPTQDHPTSPSLSLDQHIEPPELTTLLFQYAQIFIEATQLPPPLPISHHIHLPPNSKPINVKSYRYPHSQKVELEKQIQLLLEVEFILQSFS